MIEIDITQYIPIDIKEYEVKYKIIDRSKEYIYLQVILFPTYLINRCIDIAYMLNMKPKLLNVNFDILQKLISSNLIDNFNGNGIFIELKENDFILNLVENNIVYQSHILPKTSQSYESVIKLTKKLENIYYYGEEDELMQAYFKNIETFHKLKLKDNIKIFTNDKKTKLDSSKYINSIGMII